MSSDERASLRLTTAIKLCTEKSEFIRRTLDSYDAVLKELLSPQEAVPPEPPEPKLPSAEEQAILDLYDDLEDGVCLSTSTIAQLLDDSPTNGNLKRRLAAMVRNLFLHNDGRGYRKIWCPS